MIIEDIPLTKIKRDPNQPRKSFPRESLKELADSMDREGLIQPITLRPQAGGYTIVTGERRYRAARLLGWKTIRAIIEEVESPLIRSLIENLQREDLNPLEEAEGYRMVLDSMGITQEGLAGRIGKTRKVVIDHLYLLRMTKKLQNLVRMRTIAPSTALELSKIKDVKIRNYAISQAIEQNITRSQIRNLQRVAQRVAQEEKREIIPRPIVKRRAEPARKVLLRIPWLRIEITKY